MFEFVFNTMVLGKKRIASKDDNVTSDDDNVTSDDDNVTSDDDKETSVEKMTSKGQNSI